MRIIVTGGAGFIGSAFIRLAIAEGHTILNLDLLTYAACLDNLTEVDGHANYEFIRQDICDAEALRPLFEQFAPDAIIHLAAESHVDRSINKPSDFIHTNIIGTYNLLEAARHYYSTLPPEQFFVFHHVGTDEVFGSLPIDAPSLKFNEKTPYAPRSPYSASKASSDHLVMAWHETYALPVVMTNCSNNYGPYQFPEKLIPLMILNALAEKPLPIYGDGKNIRDWLYVEDHAAALLNVLEHGRLGGSYCIGGDSERANIDIVRDICHIMDQLRPRSSGSYSELITFVKDRLGHDARYAIDASHVQSTLNWAPSISFEDGLKKTVEWYLAHEDWWRPLLNRS